MATGLKIFLLMICILFGLGFVLPYIESEFTGVDSTRNIEGLESDLANIDGTPTYKEIAVSVGTILFYTRADVPFFIGWFLILIRIIALISLIVMVVHG